MSLDRIYQLGGPTLVVGAIVNIITTLSGDVLSDGFRPAPAGYFLSAVVNLLSLLAGILVVFGFSAVYARQAHTTGPRGRWGWVLTTTSVILFGVARPVIYLVAVPLSSAPNTELVDIAGGASPPPLLALFFLVATLLFTGGTILFGLATNRAAIFPTWTGWALLVSGLLAIGATVIRLAQPSLNPVAAAGPLVLFFVAVGAMGWWLGMPDGASASRSAAARS